MENVKSDRVSKILYCGRILSLLAAVSLSASSDDLGLVAAAKRGDHPKLRLLLQRGVNANTTDANGATALAWAAHQDDLEAAALLIKSGADVNRSDSHGVSPLYLACENGSEQMVRRLLGAGADPNAALKSGQTALMTASRTGNLAAVELLLSHDAKVNARENSRGQTSLMWAVAENHDGIVRELIDHGADVNARSIGGFTPLLFAAQQGNLEIAKMLLAAGAWVNDATPQDGNALLVASASGHERFSIFLLENGAEPNIANAYGVTALDYAMLRGLSIAAGVRWEPDAPYMFRPNMSSLVRSLLSHGANPNLRISKRPSLPGGRRLPVIGVVGATAYIIAAASYDAEMMRLLVSNHADPLAKTAENSTALHFAAGLAEGLGYVRPRTAEDDKNALAAVKVAVELGNDMNAANKYGDTPLHGAAYVGSDAIVQFLVEHGANVNVADEVGQTPLTVALRIFPPAMLDDNLRPQFVHQSTADLLLKYGASPPAFISAEGHKR